MQLPSILRQKCHRLCGRHLMAMASTSLWRALRFFRAMRGSTSHFPTMHLHLSDGPARAKPIVWTPCRKLTHSQVRQTRRLGPGCQPRFDRGLPPLVPSVTTGLAGRHPVEAPGDSDAANWWPIGSAAAGFEPAPSPEGPRRHIPVALAWTSRRALPA